MFDLAEATLVDRKAVRFLAAREAEGIFAFSSAVFAQYEPAPRLPARPPTTSNPLDALI